MLTLPAGGLGRVRAEQQPDPPDGKFLWRDLKKERNPDAVGLKPSLSNRLIDPLPRERNVHLAEAWSHRLRMLDQVVAIRQFPSFNGDIRTVTDVRATIRRKNIWMTRRTCRRRPSYRQPAAPARSWEEMAGRSCVPSGPRGAPFQQQQASSSPSAPIFFAQYLR